MDSIETFKLSEQHTVYRTKYRGKYSKEDFIQRIADNKLVIYKKHFKHFENFEDKFLIDCEEFKAVNRQVLDALEIVEGKKIDKVAKHSWVYTQRKDFNMNMHKHDYLLYTTEKTSLETQWTCTFYVQLPKNVKKGEGDIVFMTEDKKLHTFTPEENDIIIFGGTLNHMVTQTPDAEINRVVYATNFNFNFIKK